MRVKRKTASASHPIVSPWRETEEPTDKRNSKRRLKAPALDTYAHVIADAGFSILPLRQQEVSTGTSLTVSMQNSQVFPNMVLQMSAIGEESGSLDSMLSKAADIYEREVDDAVESLSSLMEPMIMVVLGTLIGGLVVAMYLPIFKLGQVV